MVYLLSRSKDEILGIKRSFRKSLHSVVPACPQVEARRDFPDEPVREVLVEYPFGEIDRVWLKSPPQPARRGFFDVLKFAKKFVHLFRPFLGGFIPDHNGDLAALYHPEAAGHFGKVEVPAEFLYVLAVEIDGLVQAAEIHGI